jgi:hypothetical protein
MPFANDFFSSNRFKNLFGGAPPPQQGFTDLLQPNPASTIDFGAFAPPPSPTPAPTPQYDAGARMRELYNPSTDATARFEELLGQYPEREKPGVLRTIAAMLRDYTKGPEEGRAIYNQPFNEELMDWKNQVEPAQQAANLERQENVNARTLAYNTLQGEQSQRRQEETERKNLADQKIKQQRADIYAIRSARVDLDFDFSGPTVLVADPKTGRVENTGVPTGHFSEAEKMALQHKNVMSEIGERTAGAKAVKETVPGKAPDTEGAAKPESPTQTKVGQYNKARQLKAERPDLGDFIELDTLGANTFDIAKPGGGGWFGKKGPTPEQHKEITNYVYGKSESPSEMSVSKEFPVNTGKVAPMTKTQTNVKTGAKRTMVSLDGGKTWQVQGQVK